eukprot:5085641-Pleurochrysis_carterae.AAC.5
MASSSGGNHKGSASKRVLREETGGERVCALALAHRVLALAARDVSVPREDEVEGELARHRRAAEGDEGARRLHAERRTRRHGGFLVALE